MIAAFAGVDEAGRGALAGPVVAAAVVLPAGGRVRGVRDSKQLTPRRREVLEARIRAECLAWAVGLATVEEIDRCNVLRASLLAMRRALDGLGRRSCLVRVDGPHLPGLPCAWPNDAVRREAVIGGDRLCPAIAAASVLAKQWRDRAMRRLDQSWPGYRLAQHKGYGVPAHLQALRRLGASPVHRMSFRPVRAIHQS